MRYVIAPLIDAMIVLVVVGCGSGGDSPAPPTIAISVPTSAASYATTSSEVGLGGVVTGACCVTAHNARTGSTTHEFDVFVVYSQGRGSWTARVRQLAPGDNPITVTATEGNRTASAQITVTRPLQPAAEIINGPDQASANTFWTTGAHKLALFADGTGRSTTGTTMSQTAGPVVDMMWSLTGPEAISINGCATCAFQTITRISGSIGDGRFLGQVVTVGGDGNIALSSFILTQGKP